MSRESIHSDPHVQSHQERMSQVPFSFRVQDESPPSLQYGVFLIINNKSMEGKIASSSYITTLSGLHIIVVLCLVYVFCCPIRNPSFEFFVRKKYSKHQKNYINANKNDGEQKTELRLGSSYWCYISAMIPH